MFYASLTKVDQDHLIEAAHFEFGRIERMEIRQRLVDLFSRINHDLAVRVAQGIGAVPPTEDVSVKPKYLAPEVSPQRLLNRNTMRTKRVAVLCSDGVDGVQYFEAKRRLQEVEGGIVEIVAPRGGLITTVGGEKLRVAKALIAASSVMYDSVYVPGGRESVNALLRQPDAIHFLEEAFRHGKPISASNEGVELLVESRLARHVKLSEDPNGRLVVDKGVATTRSVMLDRSEFLDACVASGKQARFFEERSTSGIPA
jgi:catalase